jgi:hypothetical protein
MKSAPTRPDLEQLPFLKSLCWQGLEEHREFGIGRDPAEILAIYERGWRWRGVMADISEVERQYIRDLAAAFSSWLINDV